MGRGESRKVLLFFIGENMTTNEANGFALMQGIINIIVLWWPLIGPPVSLVILVRFLKWLNQRGRGGDSLADDVADTRGAYWGVRERGLAVKQRVERFRSK